jgi:hypothetical protein
MRESRECRLGAGMIKALGLDIACAVVATAFTSGAIQDGRQIICHRSADVGPEGTWGA